MIASAGVLSFFFMAAHLDPRLSAGCGDCGGSSSWHTSAPLEATLDGCLSVVLMLLQKFGELGN